MKSRFTLPIVFAFAFPHLVMPAQAQVVPGTGQQIVECFDDFEDPTWSFTLNLPKSSANIDKVERHPSGFSSNRLFLESLYRGTPDYVHRVDTPPGGIPGSKGALAMQTLNSGIPGQTSRTFQQDDLIASVQQRLGYMLPASWTPSYTCRVYIPPFEKWERRHGSHFGFRADCMTTINSTKSMGRLFKNMGSFKKQEQYWPGFFIQLNTKQMTGEKEDYATILIRSDERGHDVPGPKITHAGWWTLGLSITSDGKVHYYAHEGVANLTARDHLYSNYPYGYHCEQTSTYFFNIVNQDDGRTWSTRWIVDDPKVYVATGNYRPSAQPQVTQQPAAAQPQTAAKPATPAPATVPVVNKPASNTPAPVTAAVKPSAAAAPALTVPPANVPSLSSSPMPPVVASKPDDIPAPNPETSESVPQLETVPTQTPEPVEATPASSANDGAPSLDAPAAIETPVEAVPAAGTQPEVSPPPAVPE
ncbi:hypothetical protein [Schlesneria paludicola]|uniref:hypothetical protein n=1 Tax=Schlesneria paludicola TaxID=360056 RepID=UPI00029A8C7F|nr:hypothetical protein [Schlesneria paludicola]